ncbi:MAG: tetratricopeptide repeat protein [Elusimicrobiota bacterium]
MKDKHEEVHQNAESGEPLTEEELEKLMATIDWDLVRRKSDMENKFKWQLNLNQTKKYAQEIYEFFEDDDMPIQYKFNVVDANIVRSEKIFRRLIPIFPESIEMHTFYVYALMEQRKREEVVAEYERAIKAMPDYPDILNNFALALEEQDQYNDAERYFKQSIKLDPDNSIPYNNLGYMYENLKRYHEAYQAFEKAHKLDPENEDYKIELKKLRRKLRREIK